MLSYCRPQKLNPFCLHEESRPLARPDFMDTHAQALVLYSQLIQSRFLPHKLDETSESRELRDRLDFDWF